MTENDALAADVERALEWLQDAAAEGGYAPSVVDSLLRQLEWCRGYLNGDEMPLRPGPFSMGLIATRELDMYSDRADLADLINSIQGRVNARVSASRDIHALASVAWDVADLYRSGELTRKQSMKILSDRFPDMRDEQLERAFTQGLSDTR